MKHLATVLLVLLLTSCNGVDDARKVHVGMTTDELIEAMGDPWSKEIEVGHEDWYFTYYDGGHQTGMEVEIVDGKVTDFYSY